MNDANLDQPLTLAEIRDEAGTPDVDELDMLRFLRARSTTRNDIRLAAESVVSNLKDDLSPYLGHDVWVEQGWMKLEYILDRLIDGAV